MRIPLSSLRPLIFPRSFLTAYPSCFLPRCPLARPSTLSLWLLPGIPHSSSFFHSLLSSPLLPPCSPVPPPPSVSLSSLSAPPSVSPESALPSSSCFPHLAVALWTRHLRRPTRFRAATRRPRTAARLSAYLALGRQCGRPPGARPRVGGLHIRDKNHSLLPSQKTRRRCA